MAKTTKHTDLSGEYPGPRAIMDNIEFSGDLPLIGRVTVKAGLRPGSPLTLTVTTVALVWAGCSCAVTSFALGLPGWAAAGTIVLPTLIHLVCSHRRTGR